MILLSPCFSPLKNKYNWGTASNYSKHGRPRLIFVGLMRICGRHLARFFKIFLALFYFEMKISRTAFFFHMLHAVVGVDPLFAANWTLTLFYILFFFSQNSSAWS